ncbi:MAG TPA: exodeoxyribonuclease VII large subunit, partial [Phycisphaerae bacterium]|nr:exodeoxyribonuclease VII large subunit [Phycisphaerae bacterium]
NAARRRDRSRANPSRITGAPRKADPFHPLRHLATGNTKRETPFVSDRPLFDPARIRLPGQARPGEAAARGGEAGPPTYSVRQVNELVRGALLRHLPPTINVLGEIGDFSRPSSGHLYFTLKEAGSELACVMFRSAAVRVRFEPQAGMEVIASGTLDVYMPRGSYQLYVRKLEPRGVGALELAFRQLKEKLEREGLFDAPRKKPLPAVPQRIAVITSPTGAAVRDILQTLRRRFPALHVLVFPVRVQGEGAALEIAAAIRAMNAHAAALGGIDAAIVGRGGGSLEDLWPFNEEVVARAIAASTIPIISAVGHETDISISDLVADVRAATPTAAAELIAPRVSDLLDWLDQRMRRVARGAGHAIQLARARLSATLAYDGLARPLRRLRERAQMLDELQHRLQVAAYCRFRDARQRLNRAELALLRFRSGGALRRLDERVSDRLHRVLRGLIQPVRVRERLLANRLARLQRVSPERRLAAANEHLQQEMQRLHLGMRGILHARRERLERRLEALTAYSPQNVLNRGYSITRDARTHEIIRSIDQIREGVRLITRVSDGEFRSRAEDPRQGRLFD